MSIRDQWRENAAYIAFLSRVDTDLGDIQKTLSRAGARREAAWCCEE